VRISKQMILAALALFGVVSSHASRMDEVTLVMVPREDKVVDVGKDLASRYPTLLISYQIGGSGTVSLHGWTGSEWVNITPEAYKEGAFFHNGPTDAILVEKEGKTFPESLVPSDAWCSSVHKISTTETRPLLHLIGQHYDFRYADWKWFASNYKLSIEDINPEGLNVAWYNKPLGEHLQKKNQVVGTSDLEYWSVVRQPMMSVEPAAVTAPEDAEPAAVGAEPSESMDNEELLTNSVPDAVILGAADADADVAVEAEPASDDAAAAVEAAPESTDADTAEAQEKAVQE